MLASRIRLGPYEILAPLGAGGMGEVYRARDTRLGRQVAVKILPEGVASDPRRVARFETEARALAALSHPNILGIHDFGQSDGHVFAVTELLEGETLRERISGEPVAWRKAAEIAAEIADGLASAHGAGIVHRDLKPENVFLTSEGRVKILDFGLAKVAEPVSEDAVTLTSPAGVTASADGQVVGTLSYMAPEQLSGRRLDGRADIFALGCVLFEMLSGKRPFTGATPAETMSAILRGEPPALGGSAHAIPPALERIVFRCLEKRPEDRFDTSRDLALALRSASSPERPAVSPRAPRMTRTRGLSMFLSAAVLGSAGIFLTRSRLSPAPGDAPLAGIPRQVTTSPGWDADPALSPDETLVAYASNAGGRAEVWLIEVQGGEPLRLTNDEGEKSKPAWFPDGRSVAYVSSRGGKPSVWKIPRLGGSPTLLLDDADMPAISPDGKQIAFARTGPTGMPRIWCAPLNQPTDARMLTGDDGGLWDHVNPSWSPDGAQICYSDWTNLWLLQVESARTRPLTNENAYDGEPVWSNDGSGVYFSSMRGGTTAVWRVSVDGRKPVRGTLGPGPERHPSISRDGRLLVYSASGHDPDVLVIDRIRGTTCRFGSARVDGLPAISPDGDAVVYVSNRLGKFDLWIQPLSAGRPSAAPPRRLTDLPTSPATPVFSPDGRWVAYFQALNGGRDIWMVPVSGGAPVRITDHPAQNVHPSFSPDGSQLAFVSSRSGREHVWILPIRDASATGVPWQLTDGGELDMFPAFSPATDLLAFVRNGEIWMTAARKNARGRRVTTGAEVHHFAWEPDGRSLLASGTWGTPMLRIRRVRIDTGATEPLTPDTVLGDREAAGYLGLSRDGRYLAVDVAETKGNLWTVGSSAARR